MDAQNRLAHVCILVRDIDQAIEHYRRILEAALPQMTRQAVVKEECRAGRDHYYEAFFPGAAGGCDIQLLQPIDPGTPLYDRLEKHGEGVHHIAVACPQLEDTLGALRKNGVKLNGEELVSDPNNPGVRWQWILPSSASGVLIEVMDDYRARGGGLGRG